MIETFSQVEENFLPVCDYLRTRPYPGRGILLGSSADGKHAVAAYFIMGRSQNSQNRILRLDEDGRLLAVPFDSSKVEDPTLILYTAIYPTQDGLILANGDHADNMRNALLCGQSVELALEARAYEPDAPHFTPRIAATLACAPSGTTCRFALLRKDRSSLACVRTYHAYHNPPQSHAYIIHTYSREENGVLQPFCGKPLPVLLPDGDLSACANALWESLNPKNRIALYVCFLSPQTGMPLQRETVLLNRHALPRV